jgi:hypothetical protein
MLPLHHSHHERSGDDRTRTGDLSPDKRVLSPLSYAPEGRWKAGSASRNRRQRRCRVEDSPEPAVAHRRSCQRVSAPPPPHRSALEACRSQLHVRARALHQPLFRHFLDPPVDGSILNGAGGIRTHDLELMRLARTAAPLPRCTAKVWPAGVEPAISGAQNRRGGHAPLRPDVIPPAGLEPAFPS